MKSGSLTAEDYKSWAKDAIKQWNDSNHKAAGSDLLEGTSTVASLRLEYQESLGQGVEKLLRAKPVVHDQLSWRKIKLPGDRCEKWYPDPAAINSQNSEKFENCRKDLMAAYPNAGLTEDGQQSYILEGRSTEKCKFPPLEHWTKTTTGNGEPYSYVTRYRPHENPLTELGLCPIAKQLQVEETIRNSNKDQHETHIVVSSKSTRMIKEYMQDQQASYRKVKVQLNKVHGELTKLTQQERLMAEKKGLLTAKIALLRIRIRKLENTRKRLEVYNKMNTVEDMINRLVHDRPQTFYLPKDHWRTHDNKIGVGWPRDGLPFPKYKTARGNPYLNTTEIELGSWLGISAKVTFNNQGMRAGQYIGKRDADKESIIEQGYLCGYVGIRMENDACMMKQLLVYGLRQKLLKNPNLEVQAQAISEHDIKRYKTYLVREYGFKENHNLPCEGDGTVPYRKKTLMCGKKHNNEKCDKELYKFFLKERIATFLAEVEQRMASKKEPKAKAYVHAVGIGSGAWACFLDTNELHRLQYDCYNKLLATGKYPNIGVVDCSYFGHFRRIEIEGVILKTSVNEPSSAKKDNDYKKDMILFTQFAYDSNAAPGNEGRDAAISSASGDPCACASTSDSGALDPAVNGKALDCKKTSTALMIVDTPDEPKIEEIPEEAPKVICHECTMM